MPQFLINPGNIINQTIRLGGDDAKHIVKVLRHKTGDIIFLSDGKHQYHATITDIRSKEVELKITEKHLIVKKAPSPALAMAILKHDHLEIVLQKGVELGVAEFFLFSSERTIPHYDTAATPQKMIRFQKIALEAAKQSGMVTIPKIDPLLSWQELLQKIRDFSGALLCWEEEETENSFRSIFKTVDPSNLLLVIGPEGGFTHNEVIQAEKAGAKRVSLGQQILRSETAAVAAITLSQYELGNIG